MATPDLPEDGGTIVMPCPGEEAGRWIGIELVDAEGRPVAHEDFRVVLPDGSVVRGFVDGRGCERIAQIARAGTCQVGFRGLDRRAWRLA